MYQLAYDARCLVPEQNDERAEVELLARGDVAAFIRVYNHYRDRIYGFAYRMLGEQSIAEDVTHEAFLVLIQHPNATALNAAHC